MPETIRVNTETGTEVAKSKSNTLFHTDVARWRCWRLGEYFIHSDDHLPRIFTIFVLLRLNLLGQRKVHDFGFYAHSLITVVI